MGRLTYEKLCEILQHVNRVTFILDGVGEESHSSQEVHEAIKELQKYKDLEEQGRLIELPCKVGDTVYAIAGVRWIGYEWKWKAYDEAYVQEIKFNLDMLGDTFFLTKEEAEAKLKELKPLPVLHGNTLPNSKEEAMKRLGLESNELKELEGDKE